MNMFNLSPAEQARDPKKNYLTLFIKAPFLGENRGLNALYW